MLTLNALLGLGTALAPVLVAIFVGLGFWWGLPIVSTVLLAGLLLVSVRLPSPIPGPPRMRQVLDTIPPASVGIVLGCGIVSVDLFLHHQPVLSAIMLWFAAGVWLLLAVILSMPLAYQRDRFGREARSPAAFTGAYLETCGGWRRHAEPGLFEVPCS